MPRLLHEWRNVWARGRAELWDDSRARCLMVRRSRGIRPGLALRSHLQAYRNGGFRVAALCDHTLAKAESRRDEFFPDAAVTCEWHELLQRQDIAVLDITTHPEGRAELIEAALCAGRPFWPMPPWNSPRDRPPSVSMRTVLLGRRIARRRSAIWARSGASDPATRSSISHSTRRKELPRRSFGDGFPTAFKVPWANCSAPSKKDASRFIPRAEISELCGFASPRSKAWNVESRWKSPDAPPPA